jgi:hypothetical protein
VGVDETGKKAKQNEKYTSTVWTFLNIVKTKEMKKKIKLPRKKTRSSTYFCPPCVYFQFLSWFGFASTETIIQCSDIVLVRYGELSCQRIWKCQKKLVLTFSFSFFKTHFFDNQ